MNHLDPTPLTDLTDAALAHACEANPLEWRAVWSPLPGQETHRDPDVTWFASAARGRVNAAGLARFTPRSADERIDTLARRWRELDVRASWWVGPSSTPKDLGERLRARGFRLTVRLPGMACALRQAELDVPDPPGVRCELIEDYRVFDRHAHPGIAVAYAGDRAGLLEGHVAGAAQQPRRVWDLVAWAGERIVASATVASGAGVAGLYGIVVLPSHRRLGIGSAITRAALRHARAIGFHAAVLQASGAGACLYSGLGFRTVCRIGAWQWTKAQTRRETAAAVVQAFAAHLETRRRAHPRTRARRADSSRE